MDRPYGPGKGHSWVARDLMYCSPYHLLIVYGLPLVGQL